MLRKLGPASSGSRGIFFGTWENIEEKGEREEEKKIILSVEAEVVDLPVAIAGTVKEAARGQRRLV